MHNVQDHQSNPNLAYIAACELADCAPVAPDTVDGEQDTPAKAAVVASSLLAFTEGTSEQSRQDVMDSFLFATLVASKAFKPDTQAQQWYGKFNEVLAKLGWLSSQWRYSRHEASEQRLSMDEVGLEILASVVAAAALPGPVSVAMLKVAADAVKKLKDKSEPLRLFQREARGHQGGSFVMASCSETKGMINVLMGAVNFRASSAVTDVLFWKWSSSEVEAWRGESSLVLNSRVYAQNRVLVQEKLATSARKAIVEFDI